MKKVYTVNTGESRHGDYSNTLQQSIVQQMQRIPANLARLAHRLQLFQQIQAQGLAPEVSAQVLGNDLAAHHRHPRVLIAPLEEHIQQLVETHHFCQFGQILLQEIVELVPLAQVKHNLPLTAVNMAWTVWGRTRVYELEHLFKSPTGARSLFKLHRATLVGVEIARGLGAGRQHPFRERWVDGQDCLVGLALAGWLVVGGRDKREDNIGGLAIEIKSGHQLHHRVDGLAQHGQVLVFHDAGRIHDLEWVVERDDHYELEPSVLKGISVV